MRGHLDLTCGTFVARVLPPWHDNLAKPQVKGERANLRFLLTFILMLLH